MNITSHDARLERIQSALSSQYWCFRLHSLPTVITLQEFLSTTLSHLDISSWPVRIKMGGVFVNGLPVQEDFILTPPTKVEYYEPKWDITQASSHFPTWSKKWIVFQDEWIGIVFKPNRLPTLPVKEQRWWNLKKILEDEFGDDIHLPSRLDTSTQGLVLFSKNRSAHRALQLLFEERRIIKRYLFATASQPTFKECVFDAPIGVDPLHPILRQISTKHGKDAQTYFKVVSEQPPALIEAYPITGRTHQIRLHAQSLSMPIVGDNFYGGAEASELHLICYSLEFSHPITHELISVTVPKELIPGWLFSRMLCIT